MACLLRIPAAAADEPRAPNGRQVFKQKCASCHGTGGEGVQDRFDQQLVGDKSVGQLTRYVAETMPEDDPESVVGEEAHAVAAYIHDAFYSELARERLRPATIELSRLTVRQSEHAVADLIGVFRPIGGHGDQRGLAAEYYNDRRTRRDKRVIERIDPLIDFDFSTGTPDAGKIDVDAFAIKWEGGLIAPETGIYEFTVETENGAKVYINNSETPLIDAWVRSGNQDEYTGIIRLLSGRVYPLRVEFFKYKEETASIRLKWRPPHHARQVIPQRALIPDRVGPVFVLTTPFPPDDRSIGYERGTAISKAWHEATTRAALEVAGDVADHLSSLTGVSRDAENRPEKLREFCRQFAERAFRRPLTDEQRQVYVDRQFDAATSPETAVKRAVILTLTSPRFLYREAKRDPFDDFATASWMSFALWDSSPDNELWKAAESGKLHEHDQIAAQAARMVDDDRTRAKLREFFHQWLNVDRFQELAKDPRQFPRFDEALVSDLRTSLDLFLEEIVWSEASDFRQLLLSEALFLNDGLATFYGGTEVDGEAFQKMSLPDEGRAGVLSHPFLMAGFAYDDATSPIHRGVFLARSLLGRTLKPPPMAVAPTPPELAPELTTRQRILAQTEPVACQTCHRMINPLGFSMEHFDAVGRFRTDEQGRPINATGSYLTREGTEVTFTGVRDLAQFLAQSKESQQAFIEQLFQYTIKQPILAFGPNMLDELQASFVEHEFSIRHLLAEIVTRSALKARELQPASSD